MKNLSHNTISLFVMLIVVSLCETLWAQYPAQAKILTYNIYAMGHDDGPYDDIAAVLNEINADISGHQEVDSCNPRNPLDVIGWLGEQTNMYDLFAPGWKNWGDGHYGEGLLADSQIISHRLFWVEEPGCEDRGAIEIGITMGGERVRILTTHLAHEGESQRIHQAEEMVKWIDSGGTADIPMVIMGDFNSRPGQGAMSIYEDADFVYVRDDNGNIMDNIDHIMYRPEQRWKVIEAEKPTQYTASDHDPVWAIMELQNPTKNKAGHTQNVKVRFIENQMYLRSQVVVHFELVYPSKVSVHLVNSLGKHIHSFMTGKTLEAGTHSVYLNESRLLRGVYLLNFIIGNQKFAKKIAVVR